MDILILLTVLRMVPLIDAYEFTCPSQSHWNLRAKAMCKQTTNYTCLFDINYQINVYRDRCYRPRILGPGYKYVFQPNLNRASCSGNRYQPFNFETVGYSDCTFQKTLCNSLGQKTYENGDTRVDRKCICNTDRGYTFVINSNKKCYCNPSTEDCSCYLGMYQYNKTVRLDDIKCFQQIKLTRRPYSVDMVNMSGTIEIREFDNYKYNINHLPTDKYRIEAAKLVLMLSLAYSVVCIILLINRRRLRRCIKIQSKNEPNTEEVFTQDQTPVKTNIPVSVTLRQQLNIKKSTNEYLYITSCIKIDNTVVFTDYNNKRLIICNSDGTDIHHILLSYKPRYITEIDSNTVAVSFLNKTILIINISTRSVTSKINTSDNCYGISYNDNNLYDVIDRSIIHLMDLTGKVIRTIPVPSYPIYDITVDRDRLVCIDNASIYCCSLDGKLKWTFKKDEIQNLRRVTTDNEGNVYVTNKRTHTVIVVYDDGRQHRELLTQSDGLDQPCGIYFDKKENTLLVCNICDAFLFDVKEQ